MVSNEQIIWYLEDRIEHEVNTQEEMDLYIHYQTHGYFNKEWDTYKETKQEARNTMKRGY